jgi:hypothetical protein
MPHPPKEPNPGTQVAKVLAYIREHGSITGREAFHLVGQSYITKAIARLRDMGHPIVTKLETDVNKKTGKKVRYGRYSLATSDYVRPPKPERKPRINEQHDQPEEPRKNTQAAFVLDHLRNNGPITFDEAYMNYGIEQLASSIGKLRSKGWKIDTHIRYYGFGKRIASIYTLITKPKHKQ